MRASILTMICVVVAVMLPMPTLAQERPPMPPEDMRAQPNRPGWSVDARTGCWVWNGYPHPSETVSWSGGCGADGRATGRGVVLWRYGGKVDRYEGDLRDGKLHGSGVSTSSAGDGYEGEWRDGQFHGRGARTWADGSHYDGEWRDGKEHGRGVWVGGNGDRYEGEHRDGKAHGRGVLTFTDGDRYEGEFRDDRPDGFGDGWVNGQRYSGNWAGGCFRDGQRIAAVGRPASECR